LQDGAWKKELKRLWYAFLQIWAQLICVLLFRIRVYGRKNIPEKGPVLIVSNHQSFLDPILIGVGLARQVNFMARMSLFKNRLFAFLIRSLNAFPLKRGMVDPAALRHAVQLLKDGEMLLLFPEGTRTFTGQIAAVRPGFLSILKRTRAALIPAVIEGAYQAWPRDRKLFGFHRIRVIFGASMGYPEHGGQDLREICLTVKKRLEELQADVRKR